MSGQRMARTTCVVTGKKAYRSYWEARSASYDIRHQTSQDHGRPYRCHDCHGWHLGKSSFEIR